MSKKYILPVFLLYIVTSILFLIAFSLFYFDEGKEDMYHHSKKDLAMYAKKLEFMLKFNDGYEEILSLDRPYSMNLYDIKNGRYIIKEFDKPNSKFKDHFYENKNFIYYSDDVKCKAKRMRMELDLMAKYPNTSDLAIKIIIISSIVLLVIFIISYFIFRLSYLPLIKQIKALNNFIADTTHEINTPLSVILMSVEMFDKDPKKYLENIKIASKTMSNLYSDLAMNLINEPNKLELVKLDDLIKERIQIFEIPATNKGIKILSNLEPISLILDVGKLSKIIDNLLSNAVKYSFKSNPISVSLDQTCIKISNHGNSISKENLSKIYDKFSRFDTQNGGFGIGLSLVKRYCDDLGLRIECKSSQNNTEFHIIFKKS